MLVGSPPERAGIEGEGEMMRDLASVEDGRWEERRRRGEVLSAELNLLRAQARAERVERVISAGQAAEDRRRQVVARLFGEEVGR